ncbi:MAG: recombinase family protein [Solobacterium sp.]|nr:recombinase family protein [Solobacterium sp.]
MTVFGYSRCSTSEAAGKQDINRQIRELKDAGATTIYYEHEHGDAAVKPQLSLLLDSAQAGDVIITTEISRLARSTAQLCQIIDTIKDKKLCLQVLGSITVDCRGGTLDPFSAAFCEIAAVFSELELQLIRARVRSGLENARSKGRTLGRPSVTKENIPQIFYRYYPSYTAGSLNKSELGRICGLSRNTIKKYIKIVEASS